MKENSVGVERRARIRIAKETSMANEKKKRHLLLKVTAVSASTVLAGCGSGGPGSTDEGPPGSHISDASDDQVSVGKVVSDARAPGSTIDDASINPGPVGSTIGDAGSD
jgi:hypothetical protein